MNVWVNADISAYKNYIQLLEDLYDSNCESILNTSIIIEMMMDIGTLDKEYCCCIYTRNKGEVTRDLNNVYKPLAKLLLVLIKSSRKMLQTNVFLIVLGIVKQHCHCLIITMLAVLTKLVDKDVYNIMKKYEVFYVICNYCLKAIPGAKLACVKLARELIKVASNSEAVDFRSPEIKSLKKELSSLFENLSVPKLNTGEVNGVKMDCNWLEVKVIYDYLLNWLLESYNEKKVDSFVPLQLIVKLCIKTKRKELAIKFIQDLMSLKELNMKVLIRVNGIMDLLLTIEQDIDNKELYKQILDFHSKLIMEAFKSRSDTEAALSRHKLHMLKAPPNEEFISIANIISLWGHALEYLNYHDLPWIIQFTFSISIRSLYTEDNTFERDVHHNHKECLLGLSFLYNFKMFSNFLRLAKDFCESFLNQLRSENTFKKMISVHKDSFKLHLKYICSPIDQKGEIMPITLIVLMLAECIVYRNDKAELSEFLSAVQPIMEYCLVLMEFAKIQKDKVREGELKKLFEFLFTFIVTQFIDEKSTMANTLIPVIKKIINYSSIPNSASASIDNKLLSTKDRSLFSGEGDQFKSENELIVIEKFASEFDNSIFYRDYLESMSIKINGILNSERYEPKDKKYKSKELSRSFINEYVERVKEQEVQVLEFLVNFELQSRKCAHKWKKVLKAAKQWQGAWRNKELFDTPKGIEELPYKVSSHCFANTARCIETLCWYFSKHLTNSKHEEYLIPFKREQEFYTLLQNISPIELTHKTYTIKAIDICKLNTLIGKYENYLINNAIQNCDTPYKDMCTSIFDCEIFSLLLLKPGKIGLTVKKGNGYIVFAYDKIWQKKDKTIDKRLMFTYTHARDKKLIKKWSIQRITKVYVKYIIEIKTGLEFFFDNGKNVLLNFANEEDSKQFYIKFTKLYERLMKNKPPLFDPRNSIERITQDWCSRTISNFDYLLTLNSLGSRSFNNLSQYPVFPWILTNYGQTLDLNSKEVYRDFKLSVGMMGKSSRAEEYKNKINQMLIPWLGEFNYGSHYSNPGIVLQYLMRVNPFFEGYIQLFTGLDHPNRMMHSLLQTFNTACNDSGDIRELLPEYFSFPEIFKNRFKSVFGIREDDNQPVNDVILPEWADNDPYKFIIRQRLILEEEEVSSELDSWINLIFGYQQRGDEARKVSNVFPLIATEPSKALQQVEEEERDDIRLQAFHWGQTPQQLFVKSHPKRISFTKDKLRLLCDGNDLTIIWTKPNEEEEIKELVKVKESILRHESNKNIKIEEFCEETKGKTIRTEVKLGKNKLTEYEHLGLMDKDTDDDILSIKLSNESDTIHFKIFTSGGKMINGTINYFMKENRIVYCKIKLNAAEIYKDHCISKKQYKAFGTEYNPPVIIIKRKGAKQIVQGGYLDGNIRSSSSSGNHIIKTNSSVITALKADYNERIVIAGSYIGECMIFRLGNEVRNWELKNFWLAHKAGIVWIEISSEMQLFATASLDGTVNLYADRSHPKVLRVFHHPKKLPMNYVSSLRINRH